MESSNLRNNNNSKKKKALYLLLLVIIEIPGLLFALFLGKGTLSIDKTLGVFLRVVTSGRVILIMAGWNFIIMSIIYPLYSPNKVFNLYFKLSFICLGLFFMLHYTSPEVYQIPILIPLVFLVLFIIITIYWIYTVYQYILNERKKRSKT